MFAPFYSPESDTAFKYEQRFTLQKAGSSAFWGMMYLPFLLWNPFAWIALYQLSPYERIQVELEKNSLEFFNVKYAHIIELEQRRRHMEHALHDPNCRILHALAGTAYST